MLSLIRWDVFLSIALGYVLLVRQLRSRRVKQKHETYHYPDLAILTLDDAQQIQLYVYELEFPFIAQKALEFALFRTYGIPTISGLLAQTKQFSSAAHASKRMTDTTVLILEIIRNPPGSTRSSAAISRMNHLHSLYQRSGKITNEDLLYTLSLFILEPIRWINRHEWRELTNLEMAAITFFWKKVGALGFLDVLEKWSKGYEERMMVPAQSNKDTADHTTALLLYALPRSLKSMGNKAVSVLMDERLRRAMLYDDPPVSMQRMIDTALLTRKYFLRCLALPRPYIWRKQIISEHPNEEGRIHRLIWDTEPWYVEASFANRWCLQSWLDWLAGKPIPGDQGDKFKPGGFKSEEVGPQGMSGKGSTETERDIKDIQDIMRGDALING